MQTQLNTLDTTEPIDYDNLKIITKPRPPRRRQSGASLVPFRPYVKRLTSVRQPFSFTNGYDRWMLMGRDEIFFTQSNARCIGSLIEDCDVSDVIRWDIEAESTRLPMMCKLWMIVDGAVAERGKAHLVQDAAVQVLTQGRNLRALLSLQQRYNSTSIKTTSDRRRRQSWHDVNEYHSVPYYQYTRAVQMGFQRYIQCNMDNEHFATSRQEILPEVEEETVDENPIKIIKKEIVHETVHHSVIPQYRVRISIKTQTQPQSIDRSTSIDSQLIQMGNLNSEKNEIILSSIANPYRRVVSSNYSSEIISIYRHDIEYKHRAVSTGDDYPHGWLRLNTDFILSDFSKNQNVEKEQYLPPPSPRHNQSVQTDVTESKVSSSSSSSLSRSIRIQNYSSSATTSNHYELIDEIDDGNNAQRSLPFVITNKKVDSYNDVDYRFNSYDIEKSSARDDTNINKQSISSKKSENDYNIFVSSLNHQQQPSYSTPDPRSNPSICHCFSNDTTRTLTKSSDSTSTTLLASLLERYERTLRERQRAFAIVNDELLDIDDVLKRYRQKVQNLSSTQTNMAMELRRDISLLSTKSKADQSSSTTTTTTTNNNIVKDKYRSMPGLTSEDMIKAYKPIPKVHITNSSTALLKARQPHFQVPSTIRARSDYCDLCLTGYNTNSAWIRYNERRIEELQKRIDLMLQIDDNEETKLLLPSSSRISTTATVTQRIDDILWSRSRHPSRRLYDYYRFISPHRYQHRLPHRFNQSLQNSPRLLSRSTARSITPVRKSVRISTQSVPPHTVHRRSRSASRPIVSILRPSSVLTEPKSNKFAESSHVWRTAVDGKMYALQQFSIPRYYRLYNDVSFREMYHFSRMLDTYLDSNRASTKDYSSLVKNFAFEQELLSPVTSIA
ncbi:unnamed protein product [Rotaria socialis]|uniref:Uncharacterized protein n=1 Tax=Rotaria socialis TaxID=392032 RepID=A0A818EHE7_9BILA|nr:unnamed protein product [Rotaria socialis]CAF4704187.1 unnamed protein product [Rotaria socialis]